MPKYFIQTFGCQMNYSDSERMESYLESLGFKKAKTFKGADLVIFNTCSIRQKAEDKVTGHMKTMEGIKKKKPLIVVIAGCMVRKSSSKYSPKRDKLFSKIRSLDICVRTEELFCLASLIREINPKYKIEEVKEEALEDYFQIKASHNTHKSKTQAFLPISNGCDKFCTYCIVPYSRGREKSRPTEDILKEAKELIKKGYKEIILIGQTVNSYGKSNYDKQNKTFVHLKKEPFVYLLEEIDRLKSSGLERLRWTSPHPIDMTDSLIKTMGKLKTLMPYIHLPVQSGDNRTLRRMNRPYTVEDYRKIVKKLRKNIPDISITTDIIVGFCDESEEEFENTYEFFKEMAFEHVYHAQYSDRKGTTANKFLKDNVPEKTKKQRWDKLNKLLKLQSTEALKRFVGRTVKVLVEEQKKENCIGRSEHYKIVEFKSKKNLLGKIVEVKIVESKEWVLKGE